MVKKKKSRKATQNKAIQKAKDSSSTTSDTNSSRNDRIQHVERITTRASRFGSTLVHLGVIWATCAGLALMASRSRAQHNGNTLIVDGYAISPETLSEWTEYPNPLNITDDDRASFHPVVKFPQVWMDDGKKRKKVDNYSVLDLMTSSATTQLASEEERRLYPKQGKKSRRQALPTHYSVGRYDENRVNLYQSNLFDDTSNDIDGFAGARTVHIGIDLDGPVGTKVHAFCDGVVYAAGYNADLGDYGNVIVLEHDLGDSRKVWALYGHLDDKSIKGMKQGKKVKKGQVIGRFGDIHENGGWFTPHVHFQLSIYPPDTHDMPGVVSMEDRPRALVHYPDPRQVLGPLY